MAAPRTLTAEQREAKNARDRERRAQRAAGATLGSKPERKPTGGGRRKPSLSELKRNTASVVSMVNMMAAGILPASAQPDLLQPEEVEVLAGGIAAELQANPKLLAYVHKLASASGPHMVMLAACAVIAAPRLARRGALPAPVAYTVMAAGTALVNGHAGTASIGQEDDGWNDAPSARTTRQSGTTTTPQDLYAGGYANDATPRSESWETAPTR